MSKQKIGDLEQISVVLLMESPESKTLTQINGSHHNRYFQYLGQRIG